MGLYLGGLIIGRICASEIWGAFSGALGGGGGYYPEFYGISRTSASVSSGFPSMRKLVKAQDRRASA